MAIVYTTSTPIIATHGYHFNYPSKRSALIDCCYACLALNQAAKHMPDNYRWHIYKLKNRLIETLYRQGYCVQAYLDTTRIWCMQFDLGNGKIFEWHIPDVAVKWPMCEISTGVHFVWREEEDQPPIWPLAQAVALLEWTLG